MKKLLKITLVLGMTLIMVAAFTGCGKSLTIADVTGIYQVVDAEGETSHKEENEKGIYVFYQFNDDSSMEASIIVDGKYYPVREGIYEINEKGDGFIINSGSGVNTGYSIKEMDDVPGTVDKKGNMTIQMEETIEVHLSRVTEEDVSALIKE